MSSDVDPLDELYSDPGAKRNKAGGKFAPKAKPRPKKPTSIKLPSSQSVPNIKSTDSETKKPPENKFDSVSEAHCVNNSDLASNLSEHLAVESFVENEGLKTNVVVAAIDRKQAGEEASRNNDMDTLEEIFSKHVSESDRTGDEFTQKTESHPDKDTSRNLASSESMQDKSVTDKEIDNSVESNLGSVPEVHSFDNSVLVNNISSEQHLTEEALDNNFSHHSHLLPDVNTEEEVSKNLDPLDEIFTDQVAKSAKAGKKFLPKPKLRPVKGSSIKKRSSPPAQNARAASNEVKKASETKLDNNIDLHVNVVPNNSAKAAQVNADTLDGLESFNATSSQAAIAEVDVASGSLDKLDTSLQPEALPVPVVSTSEGSAVQTCPEDDIVIDTFSLDEPVVSYPDGGDFFNDKILEIEEVEVGPCLEGLESIFDITTQSGQRGQKLQPKPRFQADTKKNGTSTSYPDESGDVSCFEHDDHTSEALPNEDLTGPAETSLPGQDEEAGITNRKLRKRTNTCSLIDEDEDEAPNVDNFADDPTCSPLEDEEHNDGEYEVEKETQIEKKPKRSRKSSSQKEKPVRKRKKGNEAADQATQKPRKKFSHSTRRNKRQVDNVLLETPEDEIDMKKLRIRDIILLGEHRERIASKEGKNTDTPPTNQSAGTSFNDHNDEYFQDEDFAPEEGQPSNHQTVDSSYFNYHTYMKKTPRSRWSKQDTELFYEGVRQFGSDISMIQNLFPDRTRAQVKLKYKKEERQQPLRLHEALINRSGDHSHFQRVIEQLKQLGGGEDPNSVGDDPVDLAGNRGEANAGTNQQQVDNQEEVNEREDEGMEQDVCEAQSPPKSAAYESEDDWCHYKSDL